MLETFHPWCYCCHPLLFSYEVQFFNTTLQNLCVDFGWHVASVGRALELQLLANACCIKVALTLTTVSTNPLHAIVGQEFGHLFTLSPVSVTFNG